MTLFIKLKVVLVLLLVIVAMPLFICSDLKSGMTMDEAVESYWSTVDKVVELF